MRPLQAAERSLMNTGPVSHGGMIFAAKTTQLAHIVQEGPAEH